MARRSKAKGAGAQRKKPGKAAVLKPAEADPDEEEDPIKTVEAEADEPEIEVEKEREINPSGGRFDDPSLRLYLREIAKTPLLTPQQEKSLAYKVRRGNLDAKQALITANLRLVVFVAKRFMNRGLSLLDLIEEGNLGLIRASEKYLPSRGFRFSTYATWWIRQSIQRGLANHGATVRVPVHVAEALHRVLRAQEREASRLGREPELAELAKAAQMPVEQVARLLGASRQALSLDAKMGGDENADAKRFSDFLEDVESAPPDAGVWRDFESERLRRLLMRLSPKERGILTARFGLEGGKALTLEECGLRFALTRERIRQIEVAALRKLRMISHDK